MATAGTNQIGKEADIFKSVIWHSFLLASIVGLMTALQAFVYPFTRMVSWPGLSVAVLDGGEAMLDFGWRAAIDARGVGEDARRDAATLAEQVQALARRVEQQAVVVQALGQLLIDRLGMSEAEIMDYVRQAAAERPAATERTCPKCGNRLPPRKSRCIYCGEDVPPETVGQTV